MPRGVYPRSKNRKIRKDDINKVARINKSINMFNQAMSVGDSTVDMIDVKNSAEYKLAQREHEYSQLVKDTEGLRRVIATQREVIDTLCRSMIEINAVEGRWRA